MGIILGFFGAALLAATGIYNSPMMQHGRCMAEPGSMYALYYCVRPPEGVPFSAPRYPPGGCGSARCPTLNEPCLNATRVASLFSAGSFRLGSQYPAI